MKTMDFVSLVLGVVGFLVFGIGVCMCLIKEWGMFKPGVVVAALGIALLVALLALRWKLAGCPAIHVNGRLLRKVLYGAAGVLVFGTGMSMTMVFAPGWFVSGIVIGVLGMIVLGMAYPLYTLVLKKERTRVAPEILRLSGELLK